MNTKSEMLSTKNGQQIHLEMLNSTRIPEIYLDQSMQFAYFHLLTTKCMLAI